MYRNSFGNSKESESPINTCHGHGDTNFAWVTTQPAARAPQQGCGTNPSLPQCPSSRGVSGCWAQNAPKTEPGQVPVTVTAQTAALHKARPAPQRPVPGATTALPHQRDRSSAPRDSGSPGTDTGGSHRRRGKGGSGGTRRREFQGKPLPRWPAGSGPSPRPRPQPRGQTPAPPLPAKGKARKGRQECCRSPPPGAGGGGRRGRSDPGSRGGRR